MTDRPLFGLTADGRWRLAYDGNQWVLQKRASKPGPRSTGWLGVSFIGSQKRHLWRLFGEKRIQLTDEAVAKMNAMPEGFFRFLYEHDPDLARRQPPWRTAQARESAPLARSGHFGVGDTGEVLNAPSRAAAHEERAFAA